MPSLRTLSKFAFSGAQVLLGGVGTQRVMGAYTQSCPAPQLSCHNTTVVENLCCFNAPGGQILQTQFWDTTPATGPEDSWTLHGLWPDRCDGTYDANCDPSRAYSNISAIISSFGATELLNYMSTYWKDYKGDDESFWYHEWAKHGTCISTLEPECYTDHKATEEVVDYFQKAVDLFKQLPSYEWLKAAGIEPSTDKTWTFAQIQSALAAKRPGVEVTLGCKSGALNEIWYHYDVRGSLQTGEFVASDPDGTKSTCPQSGIKYLPKNGGSTPPRTTTTVASPQPTSTSAPGTPFSGRGYLNVLVNGSKKGCIISKGGWYATGTCATFTASSVDNGFTLSSSKGKCGIISGALTCDNTVTAATGFTSVSGNLAVGGSANWSADKAASGSTQQSVYAGADHSTTFAISWQSV
ncbi:ribonuclease T2 [Cucurbitaria berberidis CBS 394.84]|uniref:Ribonuclease T2-like n=1 Tax=Cucurbitaria berberidis CBS 394.84 TaxID=1168544 RepID=A0A9P4GEN2_9PLEO|nr:ribonuclease T2 [Cucurbitaria berberidis CBS 394.84]KAF1843849.1 ribonuclease T2 [Cucurbitaria berberidis CBS 394.84]